MSSPEILFKATINRISSRIEGKIYETLDKLSVISNTAPDRLKKEWDTFQEEVYEEVDRLEKEINENDNSETGDKKTIKVRENNIDEKISNIREKINEINNILDSEV